MGQPEPPLVVGWTLSYEMLFYAIVTAAIAFRQPLLRWSALIIGTLALLGLVLPHRWGGATYLADPIELEFLAGHAHRRGRPHGSGLFPRSPPSCSPPPPWSGHSAIPPRCSISSHPEPSTGASPGP